MRLEKWVCAICKSGIHSIRCLPCRTGGCPKCGNNVPIIGIPTTPEEQIKDLQDDNASMRGTINAHKQTVGELEKYRIVFELIVDEILKRLRGLE